jgi:hypothetical protein
MRLGGAGGFACHGERSSPKRRFINSAFNYMPVFWSPVDTRHSRISSADYETSNLKHSSPLFTGLRGVFQVLPFVTL